MTWRSFFLENHCPKPTQSLQLVGPGLTLINFEGVTECKKPFVEAKTKCKCVNVVKALTLQE